MSETKENPNDRRRLAWRAYACAAPISRTWINSNLDDVTALVERYANRMLALEEKRFGPLERKEEP